MALLSDLSSRSFRVDFRMTRSGIVAIGSMVALLVGAAILLGERTTRHLGEASVSAPDRDRTSIVALDAVSKSDVVDSRPLDVSRQSVAVPRIKQVFEAATNYLQFAASSLPAAEAGQADAQYYLSTALRYCDSTWDAYFQRGPKVRSLDEALLWASTRPAIRMDDIQLAHARCAELMEQRNRFGDGRQWRRLASEQGYAPAQAVEATELLVSLITRGVRDRSETGETSQQTRDNAIGLLKASVASGDAEAWWTIGSAQPLLRPKDPEIDLDRLAWALAACERGYDCTESADWYQTVCHLDPNKRCQPGENGIDLLRREAGNSFMEAESRSRLLLEAMRKGDADFLRKSAVGGITSCSTPGGC